jgi:hypothetical protein
VLPRLQNAAYAWPFLHVNSNLKHLLKITRPFLIFWKLTQLITNLKELGDIHLSFTQKKSLIEQSVVDKKQKSEQSSSSKIIKMVR